MKPLIRVKTVFCAFVLPWTALFVSGCNEEQEDPAKFKPVNSAAPIAAPSGSPSTPPARTPPPSAPPLTPEQARDATLPPGHPPIDGGAKPAAEPTAKRDDAAAAVAEPPRLDGITVVIPEGWTPQPPSSGPPLGPKYQYGLAKVEGDSEDAIAKIFHYPNMKGEVVERQIINRWIDEFEHPEGSARPEVHETTRGGVTVRLLDITGTFSPKTPMGGLSGPLPNYRVIAAIVDHDGGPHHVKITGPKDTIEKWKASIDKFFESIKAGS